MAGRELLQGQRGMGTVGMLLVAVAIAVLGFVLVVAGGAYMDVAGFAKDLEENISEMQYSCLNADCEDLFLEEVEDLRVLKNRECPRSSPLPTSRRLPIYRPETARVERFCSQFDSRTLGEGISLPTQPGFRMV